MAGESGRVPSGPRSSPLAAHLYEPVPPVSARRRDVPPDLEAVVLRCLAKNPSDRFPDARSLEQALAVCRIAAAWSPEEAASWWRRVDATAV